MFIYVYPKRISHCKYVCLHSRSLAIVSQDEKKTEPHTFVFCCFLFSLSSVYNLYWNNTFSMIRFAMECICVALKESNANYCRGQSFLTYLILFLQTYYAGESVFALLAYGRHSTIES